MIDSNNSFDTIVLPKAFYVLSSFKETEFSADSQHPLAIWNSSYANVIHKFTELLTKLEAGVKTNERNLNTLMDYEGLISALCRFWDDDTTEILKAFAPKGKIGKNYIVKSFNSKNKFYLAHPSKILNKLKHNQRRILGFNAYVNQQIVPGLFIGMNKGGKWQPCNDVHYRVGDNAFSFYYELRRFFVGLYVHGSSLATAIQALHPNTVLKNIAHDQNQSHLAIRIYSLPLLFFPNELSRPLATVEDSLGLANITENKSPKRLPLNTNISIETIFSGDGVTKSFEYFDLDWKKILGA
jgi:hypothetical protein